MALLQLLPPLAALAGLCAFLTLRGRLPAALAPLAALSLTAGVLLLAGLADVLLPAAWALCALGWGLGAWALARTLPRQNRGALRALVSPGAVLFWGGAAVLGVYFAVLQPEFLNFDEYSFWGTAAKLTSLSGRLYTVCDYGAPWQATQFPALPLLSFFFQLCGRFAAWRAIWACDVLLLACLAAALAAAGRAGAGLWLPLGTALLLAPALFTITSHTANLSTTWLEFLGDVPAGAAFGAAAAFWYAARRARTPLRWLVLPVLCLAADLKSNTFVLALAAAGFVAADALLFGLTPGDAQAALSAAGDMPEKAPGDNAQSVLSAAALSGARPLRRAREAAARLGFAAAALALPAAQYALWNTYTAALVRSNAAAGGMGDTSRSLGEVAVNGLRMLLGGQGAAYYEQRRASLAAYEAALGTLFCTQRVSLLGSGAAAVCCIAALFALAVWLAPCRRERLRMLTAAVCSGACFAGYWVLLLLSYAFVLKDSTPEAPASYARYFSSYYLGWFVLACACLALQAADTRRPLTARAAVLALGAGAACLLLAGAEPQFTVLGVSSGEYAAVRAERAVAQQAQALLQPSDRVFLVYQGDDGYEWFLYSEELLPQLLEYGAGGGTYGLPSLDDGGAYYQSATADEFAALVADSGADCLLVVRTDDIFCESYASLFADGLASAQNGPALYRCTSQGWVPAGTLSRGEAQS